MNGGPFWPSSHYELTYLVDEKEALRIREYVRSYLDIDVCGVGRADYSYPVNTLYLDSEDVKLYWRAINDAEHRCELRLRNFSTKPNSPVYLEIKQRQTELVLRERCFLSQEAARQVLEGQMPSFTPTTGNFPTDSVLQKFLRIMESIQARPRLHVSFLREAYVTDSDAVRVTLDRQVNCSSRTSGFWNCQMSDATHLFGDQVLLELNFAGRFPKWLREMVETFDLTEGEADKFVKGMSASGRTLHTPINSRPFIELPYEQ